MLDIMFLENKIGQYLYFVSFLVMKMINRLFHVISFVWVDISRCKRKEKEEEQMANVHKIIINNIFSVSVEP